ncbi:hypothetical protein AK812_SmicGene13686 [Symbiodinium microadriaticum]|uniref:Uncharacterized protein n=1 Tax=Symbiodinium microadriaticum TaxID=2951 RepID=A0A1Q9E7D8_SYMMI|nr:hypothetical protein AK812_SmicGene13686 [Symbiodinium microadriaticum]
MLPSYLLEAKEPIRSKQVEDVMAAQGPIVEFRQSLSKVQRRWAAERVFGDRCNVPHARDVSSFLEKHQETLEIDVYAILPHALDVVPVTVVDTSLDSCLELVFPEVRSAADSADFGQDCSSRSYTGDDAQENKDSPAPWSDWIATDLRPGGAAFSAWPGEGDIVRIVDRTLAEAVTGPAAIGEIRKEMRRGEAKVAGLEARLLGLAEDSSSEGRIWRASMASKVDSLESAMQAKWAELQESFDQNLEVAKELIAEAKVHKGLYKRRAQRADLDAELQDAPEFQRRLNIQDNDLKRSREKSSQAGGSYACMYWYMYAGKDAGMDGSTDRRRDVYSFVKEQSNAKVVRTSWVSELRQLSELGHVGNHSKASSLMPNNGCRA